jgi:cellulose synthase/poly-beta-1,6-N-acetylglucosamine synthase-like glycosyltransferase
MPNIIEIIRGLWTSDPVILQWYIDNGRVILDYLHVVFDGLFSFFLYIAMIFTVVYLFMSVYTAIKKKSRTEKGFDLKKAPFVTIQIPTRNEIIALRCAKRCLDFDYPKNRYEILIGDDSDKPEVSKQLAEFAKQHDMVKVLKRKSNVGFKPGNLNNMLKHTNGDFIVIFDSDFTPNKDFLKRIIAPMVNDKEVSAVQARWNFNNFKQNSTSILASTIVYVFHHTVLSFMDMFNTSSLCGSAEAIRKKDLIELGGWTSGALTEDIEYTLRLYKNNKRLVYLKNLVCFSEVPHLAIDLYKQQMRWAYGVIAAYKKHLLGLLINKKINLKKKMLSFGSGFGYLMPMLIISLFMTGILSFVTHKPGPLDIAKFLTETGINISLTSGLIVASFLALYKEAKIRYAFRMLVSSFSIGLVTTYYVNKGIFKSILNKPMQWYLLNKNNNYLKQ